MDSDMGERQQPLSFPALQTRRRAILEIAHRHGALDIRVFGSVATGRARSDSDVDFLVQMESDRSVLDVCDLIVDLEALLGRPVHIIERRHVRSSGEHILTEARTL